MKGLAGFSLTVVVCLCIAVVSSFGQSPTRVSAPYTHKNLTIFLIHGADASPSRDLITLQEAMEKKIFIVYESDDVNELIVENISPDFDVFIQSGDIVKGGKQDRVLAISVIIPRNSGKISIEAFCVESDRWEGRGNESKKQFSSSEERIVSKELKIATNGDVSGSGSGSVIGGGTGGGTGSGSQTEVWKEVANSQRNISANVSVDVTANSSASSLQLSLENKKLKKATEDFVNKLADITKGKSDVIGYAFAINGKINSADIYLSNHLFAKLWPKMLRAAVVEAISLDDKPKAAGQPTAGDISNFLTTADRGAKKERQTVAKSKVITRATKNEAVYEARDKADVVVHRNYVKLN
ncbi:MAG: DUF6569 family protein [Pyrinomonadaceae bacterium]